MHCNLKEQCSIELLHLHVISVAPQLTTSLFFIVTLKEFHKIASSEELKIWTYSQRIWVYP